MKFYDRTEEIATLQRMRENAKSGRMLERYFYEKVAESGEYTILGRWWDRKGENEIDLIAANEIDKTAVVYEIKRQRRNINFGDLDEKVKRMITRIDALKSYHVETQGLDMENM
jgi:hypothetical protein